MKKSAKEQYVKICPKCGSIKIQTDYSNPAVWAYGTTAEYKCDSCGYKSIIFPEILVEQIEDYKGKLQNP